MIRRSPMPTPPLHSPKFAAPNSPRATGNRPKAGIPFAPAVYLMILCGAIRAADIFVSPTGQDDAPGTSSAPLRTIAAARDRADALKAIGPVTVNLLEGTYHLGAPLIFTKANSGTASAPIVYRGIGKAVISGGFRVNTSWSAATLNGVSVMKTQLAPNLKFDQLFLNGTLQVMARYPNFNRNTKILNGWASDARTKAQAAANPAEGPGYLRGIHSREWGANSYAFTGKTTLQWVGDNNRGSAMNDHMMAENIIEFLDAPGEWFYRKSTGELWFYPPSGTNLATAVVEAASLTELVKFVGASPDPAGSVKHIRFENVVFAHAHRSLFDSTGQFYEKITGSDWGIVRKGAVFLQNAEEITIRNSLFDHVGGNAVFMSGYNRHNVIEGNEFRGTGASCVALFGLRSSIRCPNSWSADGNTLTGTCANRDRTPGPLTDEHPSHIAIRNNLMDTLGTFEKQVAGVTSSATQFDTIRHNTIAHMPRAGINYCDGAWGGHVVDYNWVYDVVRETGDHGPFNAWGRDRNAILGMNDPANSLLDARNPTYVRMNRFEAPDGMFGIDLDDNSTNYFQEKNLVIGGGYKVQMFRHNTYVNGVTVTTGGGGNVQFHMLVADSRNYGARNVIVGQRSCLYQIFNSADMSNAPKYLARWDSNLVYSKAGPVTVSGWNNCNNTMGTWAQWTSSGLDRNSIVADPAFVDTQKVFRAGYKPRGDFNPTNPALLNNLKFKPFAMDSFGVLVRTGPDFSATSVHRREHEASLFRDLSVKVQAGWLEVSQPGDWVASIVSVSGTAVSSFRGSGIARHALDARRFPTGIYFLTVRSGGGGATRRFLVERPTAP